MPTAAATTKQPKPKRKPKPLPRRGRRPMLDVIRPMCDRGHVGWTVQFAGPYAKSWGPHNRFRYRCVPPGWDAEQKRAKREAVRTVEQPAVLETGARSLAQPISRPYDPGLRPHTFIGGTLPARHPTADHPHGRERCELCEHEYRRNEGPATGRNFLFSLREIAKALASVSQGAAYRAAGRYVRSEAVRRRVDPDSKRSLEHRRLREAAGLPVRQRRKPHAVGRPVAQSYSRESRLVAGYVDAFAPIVLAAYEKRYLEAHESKPFVWPAKIGLDSRPLRVARREAETGKRKGGGENVGEVMCAMDLTVRPATVIRLAVAGGKDGLSWSDFLRSIPTEKPPEIVVADRGPEIEWAVRGVWGDDAYLYACEGHLLKNARDAAALDRAHEWVPNPDKPKGTARRAIWVQEVPDLVKSELWGAIETMQYSVEHWEAFKAKVEELVPRNRLGNNLRKFIAGADWLVPAQIEYRAAHPGTPRGAGAAEGVFNDFDRYFKNRVFRNRRRLDLMLALIRLAKLGEADERRLFDDLRTHFLEHAGQSGVSWTDGLDHGASSIGLLVKNTRERAAETDLDRANAARIAKQARVVERADAERAEAGRDPAGRKRRAAPNEYRSLRGKTPADFPDVIEAWDQERNAGRGLDPRTISATRRERVWWICRGHESLGHLHHYERAIVEKASDPHRQCPYCANRLLCATNNLAAQYPELGAEWHPTKNGKAATEVFPGADDKAFWVCTRCPRKHTYQQAVFARTRQQQGCPKYAEAQRVRRIREGQTRRAAEKRELGRHVKRLRAQTGTGTPTAPAEAADDIPVFEDPPLIPGGLVPPDEDF